MAKRKKPRPITFGKLELKPAYVDNPDWRPDLEGERGFPRKVPAMVNVRESAIGTLASRKDNKGKPLIDASQVAAADRFRRFWEAMGGAGARAIDYSRDKVDGGQIADPIDISQMAAARRLAEAERTLGERNYELVRRVCGEGAAMTDMFTEKRARLTATDNLKASLDDLARIWGIAAKAADRPSTKYQPPRNFEQAIYTQRTTKGERRAKMR
jgi:hypothetical protein